MKTLIIHAGMGKTGTTAIQQALRTNAGRLRQDGVFCCDHWLLDATVGPHGFAAPAEFVALLDADPAGFAARLAVIFDPANPVFAGADRIVWSNESLATSWQAIGPVAAGFVGRHHQANIILYFRHQADWLVSAYLQWCVKDKVTPGRIMAFRRFCAEQVHALDYPEIMRNWVGHAAPAPVLARAYDPATDVLADFCAVAGIETRLAGAGARVYQTPGHTAHALFRIVNDQAEPPGGADDLLACLAEAGLLGRDLDAVDPAPLDIAPDVLDAIEAACAAKNALLEAEHGVRLRRAAPSALLGRRPGSVPVNTDLIAALAAMLGRAHRERTDLRDRIARLEARLAELDSVLHR